MYDDEFDALMERVEQQTGFVSYETQAGNQLIFYGTSDKLSEFKQMVGNILPTGTAAYTMDDGETVMYSRYKEEWY